MSSLNVDNIDEKLNIEDIVNLSNLSLEEELLETFNIQANNGEENIDLICYNTDKKIAIEIYNRIINSIKSHMDDGYNIDKIMQTLKMGLEVRIGIINEDINKEISNKKIDKNSPMNLEIIEDEQLGFIIGEISDRLWEKYKVNNVNIRPVQDEKFQEILKVVKREHETGKKEENNYEPQSYDYYLYKGLTDSYESSYRKYREDCLSKGIPSGVDKDSYIFGNVTARCEVDTEKFFNQNEIEEARLILESDINDCYQNKVIEDKECSQDYFLLGHKRASPKDGVEEDSFAEGYVEGKFESGKIKEIG